MSADSREVTEVALFKYHFLKVFSLHLFESPPGSQAQPSNGKGKQALASIGEERIMQIVVL